MKISRLLLLDSEKSLAIMTRKGIYLPILETILLTNVLQHRSISSKSNREINGYYQKYSYWQLKCLDRRISRADLLKTELAAWQQEQKQEHAKVKW